MLLVSALNANRHDYLIVFKALEMESRGDEERDKLYLKTPPGREQLNIECMKGELYSLSGSWRKVYEEIVPPPITLCGDIKKSLRFDSTRIQRLILYRIQVASFER